MLRFSDVVVCDLLMFVLLEYLFWCVIVDVLIVVEVGMEILNLVSLSFLFVKLVCLFSKRIVYLLFRAISFCIFSYVALSVNSGKFFCGCVVVVMMSDVLVIVLSMFFFCV